MKWVRSWFWSPVRESENWAQTLVRVSGNLLRSSATILVLVFAVVAIMLEMQARRDRRESAQKELIKVLVDAGETNGCSKDYPFRIRVFNRTSQTLMSADIEVSARERGTSTNVLGVAGRTLRWDGIVPPTSGYALCYKIGGYEALPEHVLTAEPQFYSMQLKPTEKWMLSESEAHKLAPPCKSGEVICEPWDRDWKNQPLPKGKEITMDGMIK